MFGRKLWRLVRGEADSYNRYGVAAKAASYLREPANLRNTAGSVGRAVRGAVELVVNRLQTEGGDCG